MPDQPCDHIWGEPDSDGVTRCYQCMEQREIEGFVPLPDGVSMDHEDVKKLVEEQESPAG